MKMNIFYLMLIFKRVYFVFMQFTCKSNELQDITQLWLINFLLHNINGTHLEHAGYIGTGRKYILNIHHGKERKW